MGMFFGQFIYIYLPFKQIVKDLNKTPLIHSLFYIEALI